MKTQGDRDLLFTFLVMLTILMSAFGFVLFMAMVADLIQ